MKWPVRRLIPPTPPTHLNLQGTSTVSKKLGSVGGAMAGLVLKELRARVDLTSGGRLSARAGDALTSRAPCRPFRGASADVGDCPVANN